LYGAPQTSEKNFSTKSRRTKERRWGY